MNVGLPFPIIAGPTASGKTAFALECAESLGLEIINADSLLVYRHFDIGTAKPSTVELQSIRHHLIDICDPMETFTAADFVRKVHELHATLSPLGRRALIVGGTHFYLKALCLGLWDAPPTQPEFRRAIESTETPTLFAKLQAGDPAQATKVGQHDRYRIIRALEILEYSGKKPSDLEAEASSRSPDPRFPLLWIDRPQEELEGRIAARTEQMLQGGLIEETERLLKEFPEARALDSVGYRQTVDYLQGRTPSGRNPAPGIPGLASEIRLATRQLVKSQRTFLNGFEFGERFLFEDDQLKLRTRIENLIS